MWPELRRKQYPNRMIYYEVKSEPDWGYTGNWAEFDLKAPSQLISNIIITLRVFIQRQDFPGGWSEQLIRPIRFRYKLTSATLWITRNMRGITLCEQEEIFNRTRTTVCWDQEKHWVSSMKRKTETTQSW